MSQENPTTTPATPPFEDLVREHQAGLRAFIRALGADEAFVDDLAQESFIVAYRRLDAFAAGTDFGRWLRGIARHLVANERRKDARHSRLLPLAVADILMNHEPADAPADFARLLPVMRDCVGQLPPRNRELLQRRYAGGENARSLARKLRLKADAVRQTLLRIRVTVKECIERKSAEVRS